MSPSSMLRPFQDLRVGGFSTVRFINLALLKRAREDHVEKEGKDLIRRLDTDRTLWSKEARLKILH